MPSTSAERGGDGEADGEPLQARERVDPDQHVAGARIGVKAMRVDAPATMRGEGRQQLVGRIGGEPHGRADKIGERRSTNGSARQRRSASRGPAAD